MFRGEFSNTMKKIKLLILVLWMASNNVVATEPWTGLTVKPETKMKYFLHTGFMFDAVLKTAIFSFNLATPVIAETEYDITFLDRVMIPKKTKIIGYADVLKTIDRVNVFFHTIVFPDGSEIKFSGMALTTDGSAGIPGKVKKYRERIPAKILLGTLGATASIAAPGVGGALISGISAEALKEMEKYTPEYSISVKKDIPILVYVIERIEY
mgnify:CR=1 FL=1